MKIVLSSYAEFKLGRLMDYLQTEWNIKVANDYLEQIDSTLHLISDFPEMFPSMKKDSTIRKAIISTHNSILYEIKDDAIFVLTFTDNRRSEENVMNELKKYLK